MWAIQSAKLSDEGVVNKLNVTRVGAVPVHVGEMTRAAVAVSELLMCGLFEYCLIPLCYVTRDF